MRDLLWGCLLREEATIDKAVRALRMHSPPRGPALGVEIFDIDAGHQIVLVPRTGRIQIRIHVLTPQDQRHQAARSIASWIEELVNGRPTTEEHRR